MIGIGGAGYVVAELLASRGATVAPDRRDSAVLDHPALGGCACRPGMMPRMWVRPRWSCRLLSPRVNPELAIAREAVSW